MFGILEFMSGALVFYAVVVVAMLALAATATFLEAVVESTRGIWIADFLLCLLILASFFGVGYVISMLIGADGLLRGGVGVAVMVSGFAAVAVISVWNSRRTARAHQSPSESSSNRMEDYWRSD